MSKSETLFFGNEKNREEGESHRAFFKVIRSGEGLDIQYRGEAEEWLPLSPEKQAVVIARFAQLLERGEYRVRYFDDVFLGCPLFLAVPRDSETDEIHLKGPRGQHVTLSSFEASLVLTAFGLKLAGDELGCARLKRQMREMSFITALHLLD